MIPSDGAEPLWYQDAVIYETHVRAFFDGDADGVGDFRGLTEKLDYLRDLGITAIWLLPFYPSPLRDDGYDIADYFGVHPAYGTLHDFKVFLDEAHRRGLRVITELVINHTSDQHPWFQRARRAPAGSPERDFYVWSETSDRFRDARIIFKDFEQSNWTWDPVAGAYFWHRFYAHQPDLNFDNPAVRQAIFEVVDFWLELGVDGLRLDAVPYLIEREGTDCENLPETHAILKELRAYIDARYTDRMLLAEANQWPDDAVAYFGRGDECHMAFHFPLMPRLFMAIHTEDRFPILDILDQTPPIPDACQWALFLRNHDELTLEMVTDEERLYMYRVYAQAPEARINLGIRRRLAPLLGNSRRRIELMNALLFSLPGTPVIYYGDEIGMGDNVYLGDRNGVRTPMQWSDDRHAGFSRAHPQRLYLPLITDHEYHYETVHVEAQEHNPHSLLWWMRGLIAQRKRYRAFGRGSLEFIQPGNRRVLAFVRRHEDETILVVANLSRFVQAAELDLSAFRGQVPIELIGRSPFWPIDEAPYRLTLGPHAFYWFLLTAPRPVVLPARGGEDPTRRPLVVTAGPWHDVLTGRVRERLEGMLPRYLEQRPWFNRSRQQLLSVRIAEAIAVPTEGDDAWIALVRAVFADGGPEVYALPLAFAPDQEGRPWAGPEEARVARLRAAGADGPLDGTLHDALWDERFVTALLEMIAAGRELAGSAGVLVPLRLGSFGEEDLAEPIEAAPRVRGERPSHATVRYGDQWLLKLYRRLDDGTNPELEIGRFLSDRGYERTIPLAGAIEYQRPRADPLTLAVLHPLPPAAQTAADLARASLAEFFARVARRDLDAPARVVPTAAALLDLASDDLPTHVREAIGPFLATAELLGQRTAELHLALASAIVEPAFTPVHFSPFVQRALNQSLRGLVGRTLRTLRSRLRSLDDEERAAAEALLGREATLYRRVGDVLAHRIDGAMIRIHGDLGLERLRWVDGDVVFTDFEGDVDAPVPERQLKRPPLRDVAALLRSFDEAARQASLREAPDEARMGGEWRARARRWAGFWGTWVSAAFLRGYLAAAEGTVLVPTDRGAVAALLDAVLIERGLIELGRGLRGDPPRVAAPVAWVVQHVGETAASDGDEQEDR